jgi:hypothetical protein
MNIFLVVAGTYQEFKNYTHQSQFTSHYRYIADPDMVRGLRDPHGVFIGSFRQRKDIIQIVENLIIASTRNQTLLNLRNTP